VLDGERGIFGVKEFGDGQAEDGEYKPVDAEGNPVDYHVKEASEDYEITEDKTAIVDLRTGKEVFHTAPGETIAGKFGHCWIIDGTESEEFKDNDGFSSVYFYALDDKFNVALDGMIFNYYESFGRYMLVQAEKNITYDTREQLYGRSFFSDNIEKTVIDTEGRVVYRDGDYDDDGYIRGITGNIMIKGDGIVLTYIDLDKLSAGEENCIVRRHEKLLCTMDFDDGSAPACRMKLKTNRDARMLEDFQPAGPEAEREMAKYKWGFVDENFEPITSMDFDGAYASENGYAVVIYDGSKALIRLKGGRDS
ncbi:MAG: WG repeat-containing protein, partial [Firmicutes bacterium]|nr:WG repeat-containing protein [Bacillota bacterium]